MLVQPPARRPDVSLYRLGTEPVFFDRAQSMDPQARKTKCRLNTLLTPNPSCEVSGSPTGSRSPPTRRPRKPKPPPPDPSGHHQNSAIAQRRRAWRVLHLATDADTGRIVASVLTDKDADDGSQVGTLLDRIEGAVASVTGDGA